MARALAGQAEVNSTELRTLRGNLGARDGPEPEAREEVVSRLRQQVRLFDAEVSGEFQGALGQPPAQAGTAEIPRDRYRTQQGRLSVELQSRASHDPSVPSGHEGGGGVVCKPVPRQANLFEKLEDPGQLVPVGWSDGDVRHGLSPARSSSLMRAWISSRTFLKTPRRSSSLPLAREGSWNDQWRRFSAPGKTGQASLASSQTVTT
jgi:hypothetical protein